MKDLHQALVALKLAHNIKIILDAKRDPAIRASSTESCVMWYPNQDTQNWGLKYIDDQQLISSLQSIFAESRVEEMEIFLSPNLSQTL